MAPAVVRAAVRDEARAEEEEALPPAHRRRCRCPRTCPRGMGALRSQSRSRPWSQSESGSESHLQSQSESESEPSQSRP